MQEPDDVVIAAHSGCGDQFGGGWDKLTNFRDRAVYLVDDSADAAAVERCLGGEQDAYESIVLRYQRLLFNVAMRMLGNYEDARDATQIAFVKAYEHLDTFDRGQRFFSWFYRILKNECLNVIRARRPETSVSMELPAHRGADPVETKERQQAIQLALTSLSVDYREVVVLRHFTELSYDEIAAMLGIPATTVKSRLYTARQQLSDLLVDWRITR
jgi:RNA polymerase sigma-70 factor, ECF subfamily